MFPMESSYKLNLILNKQSVKSIIYPSDLRTVA